MHYLVLVFLLFKFLSVIADGNVTTQHRGFCKTTYKNREKHWEPFTYTVKEKKPAYCGWRTCEKEYTIVKHDVRLTYKDIPQISVNCCPGYNKTDIHEGTFDCVPVCEPACEEGHCVAPGNCACVEGYVHQSSYRCVPSCSPPCSKGTCVKPNVCQCFEGFVGVDKNVCVPKCDPPCSNGQCIAPNECVCMPGFVKPDNYSEPHICKPVCEPACVNAHCSDVNDCTCFEGYVKDNFTSHACKPYCALECIHGECTAPSECTCLQGYHLTNETINVCEPDCNCTFGYCDKPNNCICYENYTLNEDGQCDPVCDCVNATCISPNVCECFDGFKAVNETTCEPECSDCDHGLCVAPEVCSCFEGYEHDGSNCVPICEIGCANGLCTAPNKCQCDTSDDLILENICFPTCDTNCTNCDEPGCVTPQITDVTVINTNSVYNMDLNIYVNCLGFERVQNETCDGTANCSNLDIKCKIVKTTSLTQPFTLLCFWNATNNTLESEFMMSVEEALFSSKVELSKLNNIQATVLLPIQLSERGEHCRICSSTSANIKLNEEKEVSFQLKKCPQSKSEKQYKENKRILPYVILALFGGVVGLVIALVLYKRRIHEYVVSKSEQSRGNDCETMMLNEETEH